MVDQNKIQSDLKYYENRLAEAKASVSQLESIIRSLRSLARSSDDAGTVSTNRPNTDATTSGRPFSGKPLAEVMRLLLESEPELHIAEMAKRTIAGGYDSGSTELKKVKSGMSAILSKDQKSGSPTFKRLEKPGFYSLNRGRR